MPFSQENTDIEMQRMRLFKRPIPVLRRKADHLAKRYDFIYTKMTFQKIMYRVNTFCVEGEQLIPEKY